MIRFRNLTFNPALFEQAITESLYANPMSSQITGARLKVMVGGKTHDFDFDTEKEAEAAHAELDEMMNGYKPFGKIPGVPLDSGLGILAQLCDALHEIERKE